MSHLHLRYAPGRGNMARLRAALTRIAAPLTGIGELLPWSLEIGHIEL